MRVNGVLGPGYKLAQSAEVQMAPEQYSRFAGCRMQNEAQLGQAICTILRVVGLTLSCIQLKIFPVRT